MYTPALCLVEKLKVIFIAQEALFSFCFYYAVSIRMVDLEGPKTETRINEWRTTPESWWALTCWHMIFSSTIELPSNSRSFFQRVDQKLKADCNIWQIHTPNIFSCSALDDIYKILYFFCSWETESIPCRIGYMVLEFPRKQCRHV